MNFSDVLASISQLDKSLIIDIKRLISSYNTLNINDCVPSYMAKANTLLEQKLSKRASLIEQLFSLIKIPSNAIAYSKLAENNEIDNLVKTLKGFINSRKEQRKKIKGINKVAIINLFNQNLDRLTKDDFKAIELIINERLGLL